jgi:hypothetical protein
LALDHGKVGRQRPHRLANKGRLAQSGLSFDPHYDRPTRYRRFGRVGDER